MKVDSPVGRFPYEPERLRLSRAGLTIEGRMGAWPAQVEVEPGDLLAAARVLSGPLTAVAGAAAAALVLRRLRYRRK
jgi:hypothetical protein